MKKITAILVDDEISALKGLQKKVEKLLPKMVDENWILFFEHDPNIQACTIHQDGKHFIMKKPVIISE